MNKDLLLSEYKLNKLLTLKNRILMAPMTRAKATDDFSPTNDMVEYYARRADAGLIITEGTVVTSDGRGHNNVPGIFAPSHIKHWRRVTDKVHSHHGLIFLQLWHVGRVSHPVFLQGKLPVSPSETTMTSRISRSEGLTYGKSRTAALHEIKDIVSNFAQAAQNAMQAGFDGVEIHGANGYLIDQFLHYHTNQRNDEYGGTHENMARFALEVVHACGQSIGYERVGMRLSPGGYLNEITGEKRDAAVFQYLLKQLSLTQIAYVHTGNFNDAQTFKELNDLSMSEFMRAHYQGTLTACGSYTFEKAVEKIQQGCFDLVAMGRPFIANHDLIKKFSASLPLVSYTPEMLQNLY